MKGFRLDTTSYLSNLGIELAAPALPTIGRLALMGEFLLGGNRGVLLRPKRGKISTRYLEVLGREGFGLAVIDGTGFPTFYAREGEEFVPIRALPVLHRRFFPSEAVLDAWAGLIRDAATRGEAARVGVGQLLTWLGDDSRFDAALVLPHGDLPIEQLGGDETVSAEPFRTAAALLAGFRAQPESPEEVVRLLGAVSPLLTDIGDVSGLMETLTPLVRVDGLGAHRLLVSHGIGAEVAALFGAEGTMVLPIELRVLEPLLLRLLPSIDCVFTDFLQLSSERSYDGVIVVPPVGIRLSGAQLGGYDLAKRGGKVRSGVAAELLFVERALAAVVDGGLLVTVLSEGLLSSAGHVDFREWLLDRARLLAVVSLPAGTCFPGSGVKCSVVLLRKPPEKDYSILMVEVEADDLTGEIAAAQSKLQEFLEREVPASA